MKIPVIYAGLKERKREMKKYMGGGMAMPAAQMAPKKPMTMMAKGGSVKQMKTCAGCPDPAACAKAGKCLMAGKAKMAKGGSVKKPAVAAVMIAMPVKKMKK